MPDYPMLRRQLQQMKDPNDPHTPDLFDAAHRHPGKSPVKSPRQKYYNPCNKRLDMWVSPRCFVQQEWQAAKVAMTQAELPGMISEITPSPEG